MQIIETRQKHENGMNDICSTTWEIILFLLLEWKLLVITKSTKSVNIHMYSWMTAHIHRREHNLSRILNIIFYHNGNCSRWVKKTTFEKPLLILLHQPIPHAYLPNSAYLATNDSEIPRKHFPTCQLDGGTSCPQCYIALSTCVLYISSWRQQLPN